MTEPTAHEEQFGSSYPSPDARARTPSIRKDDLRLLADTCQYSKSRVTREAANRVLRVLDDLYPTKETTHA